ncbi:hypothetical protein Aperf_G00000128588 [Anoplocephala perfoliata]
MAPPKAQSKYYGGENYDENDEESVKLFFKDCHQRQAALNTIHPNPNSPVSYFMSPLSKGEILYTSGQSRLRLHLSQGVHNDSKDVLDFLIFKKCVANISKIPKFPSTLDEEATAFRIHGLPLLVWPRDRDKATIQKYLDDNYPDCSVWFKELDKCQSWLNEKWILLAKYLGLEVPGNTQAHSPVLLDLPSDCITFTFVKERISWLSYYCDLLQSYLVHRRLATPGFHHSPIHGQLRSLLEERQKEVGNDAGFFNIAGNRLLRLGELATAEHKTVKLRIHDMAKQIADAQQRAHFLSVLMSMSDLRRVFALKNNATAKKSDGEEYAEAREALRDALKADSEKEGPSLECSDMDEEMDSEDGEVVKSKERDENEFVPPSVQYPNRPVTKEIMENRGVVKYRHKRERNPRVHNRYKFKKALIRYKSKVPNIRKEIQPYAGELRGIRVHMIRSHKFKTN